MVDRFSRLDRFQSLTDPWLWIEIGTWDEILCRAKKDLYLNKQILDSRDIIIFLFFFFVLYHDRLIYVSASLDICRGRFVRSSSISTRAHTLGILSSRMCQLFRKCRIPVELFDKQAGFGFVKSFIGEKLAHIVTKVCQFVDSCPVYMETRTFSRTVYLYKYTEKNVNVKYISGKPVW